MERSLATVLTKTELTGAQGKVGRRQANRLSSCQSKSRRQERRVSVLKRNRGPRTGRESSALYHARDG